MIAEVINRPIEQLIIKYRKTQAIEKLNSARPFDTKYRVNIHKMIPMQSGLGGGSSNSGTVINALNQYLKLNLSDEELNELYEEIPMGRAATPAEIAKCIKKLSEMPAYVTGQIITADGGWT